MNAVELLISAVRDRVDAGRKAVASLLLRNVEGKLTKADAAALEAALADAGVSPSEFERRAELFKERARLRGVAADLPEAERLSVQAAVIARESREKYAERLKALDAECERLAHEAHQADHRRKIAAEAQCRLQALELVERDVFGLAAVDLDAFTLTAGLGASIIPDHDPAAPRLEVDQETFIRESARRRALIGKMHARLHDAYKSRHIAWAALRPGMEGYRSPEPMRPDWPTWSDYLASRKPEAAVHAKGNA
ncbi:MAG: hypothetical protein HS116_05205 [Planctomycetes bacterium]|nr:hypothetical protein [Planctomycetota bacterium]